LGVCGSKAQSDLIFFGFVAEGEHVPWLGALWLFFSSACWLRS